ncbi:phospholipase [Pseudomonas sp. BN102]|uniref:phospholipase n=1 Tax=Pseudomonas sp. BN102 TaxID=2567886 RepID=UPI00245800FF|nr:phospholipase [Pseudomonas sp. BN102]MDH4609883.1 phospholipase [Pseudomonas sp. BN102]
MKYLALALSLSLAGLPSAALAWSNHALGTALALAGLPQIKDAPMVEVESLESFLEEEGVALEQFLDEQEEFFRDNLPDYPSRPDDLRWIPTHGGDHRRAFLMALRVNPEIKLAYFVQALPGMDWNGHTPMDASEVLVFRKLSLWREWRFYQVNPGEKLPALAVVASAADEPDYGHDINLYSDNPGEAGARYNFGKQPFGDARFEYSSQAPFHIGYYHEDALIYRTAPYLARTYPEVRVQQYLGLARFAFESGHPYWGYRFLGWGLHYIQDLTQPYHAKALPGQGTPQLVWIAFKAALGLDGDKLAAMEQVANRHTEVEQYQANWLRQLLREGRNDSPLLRAYADSRTDDDYPPFDGESLRLVVSQEAYDAADDFDARIAHWLNNGHGQADFRQGNSLAPQQQDLPLEQALVRLIRHFGAHSRNATRTILSQSASETDNVALVRGDPAVE